MLYFQATKLPLVQPRLKFISLAVVTRTSRKIFENSFGHTYIIFSELHNSNLVVKQAIGFYGDPHDESSGWQKNIFPVKLFGDGHIVEEELCYLIKDNLDYCHKHRTWLVTEQQYQSLLQSYSDDVGRSLAFRDFSKEKPKADFISLLSKKTNQTTSERFERYQQQENLAIKQSPGKKFNLLSYSCSDDAKQRLIAVNILPDASKQSCCDIPNFTTDNLKPLTMRLCDQNRNLVWDSPLTFETSQDGFGRFKNNLDTFYTLYLITKKYLAYYQEIKERLVSKELYRSNMALNSVLSEAAQNPNLVNNTYCSLVKEKLLVAIDYVLRDLREIIQKNSSKQNADVSCCTPISYFFKDISCFASIEIQYYKKMLDLQSQINKIGEDEQMQDCASSDAKRRLL